MINQKTKQLSAEWKETELGDIFQYQSKTGRKAGEGIKEGNNKFFTSSAKQTKYLNDFDFDGEFLIFPTGGQAGVHYCNEKFSASNDCLVTSVNGVLAKYVYYYLRKKLYLLEQGFRGVGLKHISKGYINKIKIIYPEKEEAQKKIVGILERVEGLKLRRRGVDGLMDDYLKSVFSEMFGSLNDDKKWGDRPLHEFGEIVTGNTPPRKNKEYYGDYIDWIKSDNLNHSNVFLTKSSERLSRTGVAVGRIVPRGSVLVTCIAGSISCIGNVAIANKEVAFNQQINSIIPNEKVNSYYLYHLINNFKQVIQSTSTKSLKGIVSKSTFSSILLPLPPITLQEKFASIVERVEKIRGAQGKSGKEIDDLFGVLMQKAFRGELG